MQGDTLQPQRTNISRSTTSHNSFPAAQEASAYSPSFPSQNDLWLPPAHFSPSCLSVVLSSASAEQLEGEQHFKTNRLFFTQNPESRSSKRRTVEAKLTWWRARRRISHCLKITKQALWEELKAHEVLKLILQQRRSSFFSPFQKVC